jgi:hypothetical protein
MTWTEALRHVRFGQRQRRRCIPPAWAALRRSCPCKICPISFKLTGIWAGDAEAATGQAVNAPPPPSFANTTNSNWAVPPWTPNSAHKFGEVCEENYEGKWWNFVGIFVGIVDVWWLHDDGGLTLLLSHLLREHNTYLPVSFYREGACAKVIAFVPPLAYTVRN